MSYFCLVLLSIMLYVPVKGRRMYEKSKAEGRRRVLGNVTRGLVSGNALSKHREDLEMVQVEYDAKVVGNRIAVTKLVGEHTAILAMVHTPEQAAKVIQYAKAQDRGCARQFSKFERGTH